MVKLTGLHILLTYSCNYACDHCFVWGSPAQSGTFSVARLRDALDQATTVESIRQVYFEGGEAFLYYPTLLEGVSYSHAQGFATGIVTNGYWAKDREDAWLWLRPLVDAGLDSISFSMDLFHGGAGAEDQHPGVQAARDLDISASIIAVDPPTGYRQPDINPGEPVTGGGVMYRGRAAEELTEGLPRYAWQQFDNCPYENLGAPGRVHLDPFGNLHLCQGLLMGNMFQQPLADILSAFEAVEHPIAGPLLAGGPAELVRRYRVPAEPGYVDACHLCYTTRQALRSHFPQWLGPGQMYGVV